MSSHWLQWYTLIFTLPTALAVILLLLVGFGSLDHDGADGDAGDGDAGDGDVGDGDGGTDADGGDAGHSGHFGHLDHDLREDGGPFAFLGGIRSLLGIGQVPLTIGGGGLLLGWGVGGLVALEILRPRFLSPASFAPIAVAIALASALLFARLLSRVYRWVMPRGESTAVSRHNLIGFTGTAIFPVTASSGQIYIHDQYGTLHQAPARVQPDEPMIPRGAPVTVLGIDPEGRVLYVAPDQGHEGPRLPGMPAD